MLTRRLAFLAVWLLVAPAWAQPVTHEGTWA